MMRMLKTVLVTLLLTVGALLVLPAASAEPVDCWTMWRPGPPTVDEAQARVNCTYDEVEAVLDEPIISSTCGPVDGDITTEEVQQTANCGVDLTQKLVADQVTKVYDTFCQIWGDCPDRHLL